MAKRQPAPSVSTASLPLAAPAALLALLIAPACRAELKISPSISLRSTYSDNVALDASGAARGQFITELAPALQIAADGPRLKGTAVMTERVFAYSGARVEGTSRSQFQLQGHGKARLVGELLFLDADAMIGQQSISAFGPQANANAYSLANRARVSTWRLSPYLLHRFGRAAQGELRYTRDSVASGVNGFGDSTANSLAVTLSSAEAARRIGWNLRASRQDTDFNQGNQTHTREQNALATVYLRANDRFRANISGGYDSYDFNSEGTPNAGRSYSLGATWTPSSRTSIDASAGRRNYGASYSLNASHRSRNTAWIATYSDAITNSRQQMLIPKFIDTASLLDRLFIADIPDPAARRLAVDAYIRANGLSPTQPDGAYNYLSNRFLLQKQLLLSAALSSARTTAVVSLSGVRRSALSPSTVDAVLLGDLAALNDNTRQVGASASLSYRLTSRSAATMSLSRTHTDSLTSGIRSNQTLLSLGASSQLQRKLRASVELHRNVGDTAVAGARKVRENAISATLSLQI